MIDENKTFILFKYTSDTLKPHSNKKVWRICDCCKEERLIQYRKCTNLCFKCSHETEEYKLRQIESKKGRRHTEETKHKMSLAKQGIFDGNKNPMYGRHHTKETKQKISNSIKGDKHPMYGKHHTEETKKKISNSTSGENHSQWKGGTKLSNAKKNIKRRTLFGFIPHNKPQKGFHGHHIDFNHVIFIPKKLHTSIYHSVVDNKNMDLINNIVCDWYLKYQIIM